MAILLNLVKSSEKTVGQAEIYKQQEERLTFHNIFHMKEYYTFIHNSLHFVIPLICM